ncbi:hypothetical protein [Chryseobacterium binzhouense]|uniref:hypothetical protein n=1 Tax=Chryseobacterium binzhouense TaxID=2593646 RepID=UPI00289BD4AE|nr:hypothetical protein [Chryseobacterium binzhouense]
MKKTFYILALSAGTYCFAQTDQLAVYAGVEMQPAIRSYQPAAQFNARAYLNEKISLGGAVSFALEKHPQNFGFSAERTRSQHTTLNFMVQNDFANTEKLSFSTYLSTGMYLVALVNPDDKTNEIFYNDLDGVWNANPYKVPRRLNRDLFYNIQGGFDFSYRLTTISKEKVSLYLTSRAGYQFVFGKGDFSTGSQFTKPVFCLGVTFKANK